MVWDLGHIANFEELWLCRRVGDLPPLAPEYERLYDAVANPRPTREALPLPKGETLLGYLEAVRSRALEVLARTGGNGDALTRDGFVYEMIAQHEEQHQETLLQLLQLLDDPPYEPTRRRGLPEPAAIERGWVTVPAGAFLMGAEASGFVYDNERQRHEIDLPEFEIERTPVTCGDYAAFIEAGGYQRPELWSQRGRSWLEEAEVEAPGGWERGGRRVDRALDGSAHAVA